MVTYARMTTLEKSEQRGPSVGWEGAFQFSSKVFLVNLISVPGDCEAEQL